jgi:hypothetical protein
MIRVFVRHTVADYGRWKQEYDAFDEQRRATGVRDDAVFQSTDDPNDVTVWHDFDSLEDAQAFTSSDALMQVLAKAGIQGEPEIWFVTEA